MHIYSRKNFQFLLDLLSNTWDFMPVIYVTIEYSGSVSNIQLSREPASVVLALLALYNFSSVDRAALTAVFLLKSVLLIIVYLSFDTDIKASTYSKLPYILQICQWKKELRSFLFLTAYHLLHSYITPRMFCYL